MNRPRGTGNSCRSQMAEGWINHLLGETWEARSAGMRPSNRVHPMAISVMSEEGVDISAGRLAQVDAFLDQEWDLVITVCDSARESCPIFPRPVEQIHISFEDPAGNGFASLGVTNQEVLFAQFWTLNYTFPFIEAPIIDIVFLNFEAPFIDIIFLWFKIFLSDFT